jgi:hypothetical protein
MEGRMSGGDGGEDGGEKKVFALEVGKKYYSRKKIFL